VIRDVCCTREKCFIFCGPGRGRRVMPCIGLSTMRMCIIACMSGEIVELMHNGSVKEELFVTE